MNIEVRYYAALREQRGLAQECVDTQAPSVEALYEELRRRHGWSLDLRYLRAAVNQRYVPWTEALAEGDTVIFMPPVSGG